MDVIAVHAVTLCSRGALLGCRRRHCCNCSAAAYSSHLSLLPSIPQYICPFIGFHPGCFSPMVPLFDASFPGIGFFRIESCDWLKQAVEFERFEGRAPLFLCDIYTQKKLVQFLLFIFISAAIIWTIWHHHWAVLTESGCRYMRLLFHFGHIFYFVFVHVKKIYVIFSTMYKKKWLGSTNALCGFITIFQHNAELAKQFHVFRDNKLCGIGSVFWFSFLFF